MEHVRALVEALPFERGGGNSLLVWDGNKGLTTVGGCGVISLQSVLQSSA